MIVAGFGCRLMCREGDILELLHRALAACDVKADRLAVPDFRMDHPAALAVAAALDLPLLFIADADLAAVQPRCATRSDRVHEITGHGAIAEACALAASGPSGRLMLPRISNGHATCALAQSVETRR